MSDRPWILHADDSADDSILVRRALRPFLDRFELTRFEDGQAAIEGLSFRIDNPPALALLDVKMPRVGGLEALEFIRAHPALREIPVVMFSSSDEPVDLSEAVRLGATEYLVKPIDVRRFNEVLRESLSRILGRPES